MNPFMALMGFLNACAAVWYYTHDNRIMAGVLVCYAVSSVLLGLK